MPNRNDAAIIDVVAAMMVNDGTVFIGRRHPNGSQGGLWEFPGGKIDLGEAPQQALARELREELSIEVEVGDYLASSEHRYPGKVVRLHGYRCQWLGDEIQLTGSHDQCQWQPPEQICRATLAPADLPLLDALIADLARENTALS